MANDDRGKLPIKIDSASNGEFAPQPVPPHLRRMKRAARSRITEHARRLDRSRREFMTGLCAAATTLMTFDEAHAAQGNDGGRFMLPKEAAFEEPAAAQVIGSSGFVFDVQTHMLDPNAAWRQGRAGEARARALAGGQGQCGRPDPVDCYAADEYIKEMFLDSDTDMAVVSFMPGLPEDNYLTLKEAARTRELVAAMGGGRRLMLHAMVIPNNPPLAAQLDMMRQAARDWRISAWKVYTQWGPTGVGWWLDDPQVGIPFIETARSLGVKVVCVHKGLTFGGHQPQFARCDDVGRVAKRYPDVNFLIYHSGFEAGHREVEYRQSGAAVGVDSLIRSLHDNGVPPNANVYAELGSTWRLLMRDPTAAAHTLGKLVRHVGEDRVLWGTDSPWFGSPQDQIQAFRSFQISPELQNRFGYAALTPALKAKIFGLNAAPVYGVEPEAARRFGESDHISRIRAAYHFDPRPSFESYGPMTAAEFQALLRERGNLPG
jgi:uncharacterized protein